MKSESYAETQRDNCHPSFFVVLKTPGGNTVHSAGSFIRDLNSSYRGSIDAMNATYFTASALHLIDSIKSLSKPGPVIEEAYYKCVLSNGPAPTKLYHECEITDHPEAKARIKTVLYEDHEGCLMIENGYQFHSFKPPGRHAGVEETWGRENGMIEIGSAVADQ
ncbi:uncharacterized protein N7482_005415 [Penicillium canariense]|uniref:Uncharacterized protein n=1 Tax=Penicillium canariense TaxID=189055 RepID=A0A9W9I2C5_9EURO|nr:uncharacterized protein N7482_005415 [Penicillium canariense]KAJ5166634.1 hypothetical protein N7482_005415 [Penicillium canariense]